MTPRNDGKEADREPRGLGEHTRGLAGEYAHELGWGLAVEQRTKGPRNPDGGSDYDYGARDFGDEPVNIANIEETPERGSIEAQQDQEKKAR